MGDKQQVKGEVLKDLLNERVNNAIENGNQEWGELISSSVGAFESAYKQQMPEMRKAILSSSFEQYAIDLVRRGKVPSKSFIKSATENLKDIDNPITMLFNLLSILIPNFAYMDACAVQPMPTPTSPIYFPQITLNENRNGALKGDKLLGATNWIGNNEITSNRWKNRSVALTVGSAAFGDTLPMIPVLPKKLKLKYFNALAGTTQFATDDGNGNIIGAFITAATINYTTGVVAGTLAANAAVGDLLWVDWRYDLDAYDPVQVIFQWASLPLEAQPRRIRSTYSLDNFYAAKKVLKNFKLDEALSSSIAGYINKEISNGVFDNMADEASETFTWDSALPSGVSWAFHRLSYLQPLVAAKNKIRKNTSRSGGNVLIAGPQTINLIETLGNDIWNPKSYNKEPIGPYNAGKLLKNITVIKNQDYDNEKAILCYKSDDTDASYAVGVFIGLYATDPLALDNLKVIQGMGTQMAETKVFDGSIVELEYV